MSQLTTKQKDTPAHRVWFSNKKGPTLDHTDIDLKLGPADLKERALT